mmetsp:Transcript_6146/g.19255  ORF Transcript_6146/g.19255 Transcript_6146/m.19255 type:complete len:136 (+) Transcript_6146:823-1230(+)|eukprot:scaffold316652_cov37-Tisochrysis_lutea.AAC.3
MHKKAAVPSIACFHPSPNTYLLLSMGCHTLSFRALRLAILCVWSSPCTPKTPPRLIQSAEPALLCRFAVSVTVYSSFTSRCRSETTAVAQSALRCALSMHILARYPAIVAFNIRDGALLSSQRQKLLKVLATTTS